MSIICPHRGHAMINGRCPYHGLCLPVRGEQFVREFLGYFPPFDEAEMEEMADDYGDMFAESVMLVRAPWFLWMQNTMDFNHLKTVHKNFGSLFENDAVPCDIKASLDYKDTSYRIAVKKSVVESYERLCGHHLSPYFTHVTHFPNLSITSFLNVFYSIETIREHEEGTTVKTQFFVSLKNKVPKNLLPEAAKANLDLLIEDKNIMESWAKTHHLRRYRNWLPHEERIQMFCEVMEREYGPR